MLFKRLFKRTPPPGNAEEQQPAINELLTCRVERCDDASVVYIGDSAIGSFKMISDSLFLVSTPQGEMTTNSELLAVSLIETQYQNNTLKKVETR